MATYYFVSDSGSYIGTEDNEDDYYFGCPSTYKSQEQAIKESKRRLKMCITELQEALERREKGLLD
jgi:hypothetical protein